MSLERESALGGEWCASPGTQKPATSRFWAALTALLLAVGAWQVGQGLWIHAKAWAAQALLARAWTRTVSGEVNVKPWPWADTWPVARLTVPRLGIERYVLAGANGAALAFGPGHAEGTAAPGAPGNSMIGGHRDTHFAFLARLRPGDRIDIERPDGRRVTYRIGATEVRDRRDVSVARPGGPTRLTLVTCYPLEAWRAGGAQRYVLIAFLS